MKNRLEDLDLSGRLY